MTDIPKLEMDLPIYDPLSKQAGTILSYFDDEPIVVLQWVMNEDDGVVITRWENVDHEQAMRYVQCAVDRQWRAKLETFKDEIQVIHNGWHDFSSFNLVGMVHDAIKRLNDVLG